ncbi:GNAT family N-acetyltransferase [Deinococcus marmoris]|uniref:Threonine synthase (TS) n=1 Tax=Deinococcus marmoris TaxID=249408 RepID=A0A1U7NV25_9DEIO|nr:GNAT family N-acetyltransferase [Deinococcus marmoris]OLV16757.1 threonine synthase (TS) [Deinococcus marmoris]
MTIQTLNIKNYLLGPDVAGRLSAEDSQRVAAFLYTHLDEYGDALEDIQACLAYAQARGGSVTYAEENGELLGAVITNRTGMGGFIPENILVYIAVHGKTRGRGLGKQLMETVLANVEGSVALHVEPHNPARKLYERLGFTNKYLEMRLQR